MVRHSNDDGLYWGHGKPSYEHENSGPNSCWNFDVQKQLSRRCAKEVNSYIQSGHAKDTEEIMMRCFAYTAAETHKVCTRELQAYENGKVPWESVSKCARRQFGLAIRNLVQTATVVGECRPIP
jgi:hypothetical protein